MNKLSKRRSSALLMQAFEAGTNSPTANLNRRMRLWVRSALLAATAVLACAALVTAAHAQTFSTLHSFTAGGDGNNPAAGLVMDSAGNLYGTTEVGGSPGGGTVFKVDTSGNETILHSFNWADGDLPFAGLVMDSAGNLYGTTYEGGIQGHGTVFKIDPSGNETVLHSFNYADGANPFAGLVMDTAGNLYGTTAFGGSSGLGTVFKIDTSNNNTETVLHSFIFNGTDGYYPFAGLVMDSAGNLYGTTAYGGFYGWGTVFKIDPSGNETILHSFNGTDGAWPYAGLVMDSAGNLYGTTEGGGSSYDGTVFKIDTSGTETILHSFNYADGGYPRGGLVMDAAGNLYGTTEGGGFYRWGTVFKIDTSNNNTETVLHSFDLTDGAEPYAGLLMDSAGNLYGTTQLGGSSGNNGYGDGTVFKITFSVPFSAFTAKLDITAGPPPGFQLNAAFTQGTGAQAIDLTTQSLTLDVGTYSLTLPAGSFQTTSKGWFVYQGTVNGVALQIRIVQTGTNTYSFQVDASGVDLTTLTNPVPVTITIGQNTATMQATASFQ